MTQLQGSILDNLTNAMGIIKLLFDGEIRRLTKMLDEIVTSNDRIRQSAPSAGFLFNGKFHKRSNASRAPLAGERQTLDEQLWDQMAEYLRDTAAIMIDIQMVNQMAHRLVGPCQTMQDLRDALPDCLVALSDEIQALERTRPEAFTIAEDERGMRQFQKIKPLMEMYSGTRLLY